MTNPLHPLNQSIEDLLVDPMIQDVAPIARLVAYLCLRYKVQAMMKIGGEWGKQASGFFDLFRNILIVTDEDDMKGLITLEMRVYPYLSEDGFAQRQNSRTVPDVPFEELGIAWFAERISISKQWLQMRQYDRETNDADYNHPLVKSLEQAGLRINHESEIEELEMLPTGAPLCVDAIMQIFLKEKPGAKSSPVADLK